MDSDEECKRMDREARTGRKSCEGWRVGAGWHCDEKNCPNDGSGLCDCPRNETDDRAYNSPTGSIG